MHSQSTAALITAHGAGVEIAFNADGSAPDWIMLLPIGKGGLVETVDGRGPYRVADPVRLAASLLALHAGRIPIDETHSTDLAAPEGRPAPARGWVIATEARADGIWGKPEWNASGTALMQDKSYRFISPVLIHDKDGKVLDLPRASLTNTPNLLGMAALNATQGNDQMDLLEQLRKLLGLDNGASAEDCMGAVKKMCSSTTSMQSIAKAAGLTADATSESIISTVTTLATTGKDSGAATIAALQSEIKDLGGKLAAAMNATATEKATAFVDNAIREGRVGVKPLRDHYISRHAASVEGAAGVEKEIAALPKLGGNGAVLPTEPPVAKDGKVALNAEQGQVAALLGLKQEDYAKTLAAEATSAG